GRVTEALEAFAENTMRYLREEGKLLAEGIEFPPLTTRFRDRHALVVARGPGYKRDLRMVKPYIRDFKPVLIAVDGGADALLEAGYRPDVIVGDMDSVSDQALLCGAELLVHGYRDGAAPGETRAQKLGVPYQIARATGISEDLALLLAYEKGSELIVAVGTHFNLIEFLERNRAGMSSTFITRLKVGEILIDAKGVSRLATRKVGLWPLVLFALGGLGAIAVAIAVSPALRHLIEYLALRLRKLLVRGARPPERFAWTLVGDHIDAELQLEESGPDRTIATLSIEAPWLYGFSRALPRRALTRLHALCQTGAEL